MGYRITRRDDGIVLVSYFGDVGVEERFAAHDAAEREMHAGPGPDSLIIDLSDASIGAYGAADALDLAQLITKRRKPFTKVAYVLREDQADMVATVLSTLRDPKLFRRFTDCDLAITWVRDPRAELPSGGM